LAAVTVIGARERRPFNWRPLVITAASMFSIVLFVAMRVKIAAPYPMFQGLCGRIHDANVGPVKLDWFCQPLPWTAHAATIAGLLLYALGFVIPGVVLAATGRRQTAFLPLLAAPVAVASGAFVELSWWTEGTWPGGALPTIAATILVMAIPVGAVMVAMRTRRKEPAIPLAVSALSWLILAVPLAAVGRVSAGAFEHHWASLGGTLGPTALRPGAVAAVLLFGALLGPDRRFWPWSIVLTAVFLSGAPSIMVAPAPWQLIDWSQFAGVVPLALLGIIASAWRPLAVWLTEHVARTDRQVPVVVGGPAREARTFRPALVANAAAAALLLISVIAFRADPLPDQLAIAAPTFAGLRVRAEDLQARVTLHDASLDLKRYASSNGSFSGFHPSSSPAGDAVWVRHLSMGEELPQITVDLADGHRARLLALTMTGSVVCLDLDGGAMTYGSDEGRLGDIARTAAGARAACGDERWTAASLAPLPVHGMCDELEPYGGYDVCRAVEVQITNELGPLAT
jgi:hypothetical protein